MSQLLDDDVYKQFPENFERNENYPTFLFRLEVHLCRYALLFVEESSPLL